MGLTLALVLGATVGCGEEAAGGDASSGGNDGAAATAQGATTGSGVASGQTTAAVTVTSTGAGPGECTGTIALDPACIPCADRSCCEQQAACFEDDACIICLAAVTPTCAMNDNFQALDACLVGSCGATCDSITPESPACDAPLPSPSSGSCIVLGGNVGCNPFTNEGCASPQVCDAGQLGGYACFDPPSDAGLCEECGSSVNNYCAVGMTCIGVCYKLCCDDGDCGTGSCDKTHAQYAPAGVCTDT